MKTADVWIDILYKRLIGHFLSQYLVSLIKVPDKYEYIYFESVSIWSNELILISNRVVPI